MVLGEPQHVRELLDVALSLTKAASRESRAKSMPAPTDTSGVADTNWPTTDDVPPASCANVTSFTIAFSSRTVPHRMHTASPRDGS